jgi:riboflavin biosynthesis pyrimidine reductase
MRVVDVVGGIDPDFDLAAFEAAYLGADRPERPGRPWVMTNFVVSADGSAAADGRVGVLTDPLDQHLFKLLRSIADVIFVGAATVRAEGYGPHNPSSDQRAARAGRGQAPTAAIAVVTASGDLDPGSPLFASPEQRTRIVTSAAAADHVRDRLGTAAELVVAGSDVVDLEGAVQQLGAGGARVVLCEGGPALLAELLGRGLVDEMCVTLSPLLLADPVRMIPAGALPAALPMALAGCLRYRDHVFLRYLLHRSTGGRP